MSGAEREQVTGGRAEEWEGGREKRSERLVMSGMLMTPVTCPSLNIDCITVRAATCYTHCPLPRDFGVVRTRRMREADWKAVSMNSRLQVQEVTKPSGNQWWEKVGLFSSCWEKNQQQWQQQLGGERREHNEEKKTKWETAIEILSQSVCKTPRVYHVTFSQYSVYIYITW